MAVPERILEGDVDDELLRRNRLGESHAALARASGCSKSLVQRRITRAKLEERRLAFDGALDQAHPRAQSASGLTAETHGRINIRAELERIIREGKDTRSVLSALKELREIDGDTPPPTVPRWGTVERGCPHCGAPAGSPATARVWTFDWGQSVIVADVTCPKCGGNRADGAEVWLVRQSEDREPDPPAASQSGGRSRSRQFAQ